MSLTIKRYLRYTSLPIIAAMVALMGLGVLAIHMAVKADSSLAGLANKQMIYATVGLGAFLVVTLIPYSRFGPWAYALFAGALVLLVGVFFLPPIRGSHRWIDLKIMLFQPSEFAKLAFILMLAWYLRRGDHYRRLSGLIVPFLLTLLPMGLILKEPDLGSSLLFLPTLYIMLFMAGAKIRHLLGIVAVATVLVLLPLPQKLSGLSSDDYADRQRLAYVTFDYHGRPYALVAAPLLKMEHHQVKRIVGWLYQNDPSVAQAEGYQLSKSKLILGAGAVTGRGGWNDAENYFRMLPDDHTDFIFSVIGGQWGFAGCLVVLAMYAVIFVMGVEIATATRDAFGRLLAVGVMAMLFTQLMINVGMTMGLMPITGMTLPLVSYGGSSLLVNCIALGLLVNVGQRRPILLGKRPFEYGETREKMLGVTTMGGQGDR